MGRSYSWNVLNLVNYVAANYGPYFLINNSNSEVNKIEIYMYIPS